MSYDVWRTDSGYQERDRQHPWRVYLTEDDSPRLVLCEACGSEGCARILDADDGTCACSYHGYGGNRPTDCPDACPWCEGTGGELIATEPVTLDDLPNIHGEHTA